MSQRTEKIRRQVDQLRAVFAHPSQAAAPVVGASGVAARPAAFIGRIAVFVYEALPHVPQRHIAAQNFDQTRYRLAKTALKICG